MEKENINQVTFYEKLQELVDRMHTEAHAAKAIYENRPNKKSNAIPIAYGESLGFSKGVQMYADELQTILAKYLLSTQQKISKTILDKGIDVFGDEIIFRSWYGKNCFSLGKKPCDSSDQEVLDVLGRIEHGLAI